MATEATETRDGPVLEVLPKQLAEGRIDEALERVRALVARNEQLERELAGAGRTRMKANEGVNHNQLLLYLDALQACKEQAQPDDEVESEDQDERDERLHARAAAAAGRARLKALAQNARPKRKPLNQHGGGAQLRVGCVDERSTYSRGAMRGPSGRRSPTHS